MFQFLTGLVKRQLAVAEVWVKMTTFQMLALFKKHFYIASGFYWRTL